MNERLVGLKLIVGLGAAETVSDTGMVRGALEAPVAVTVTVPEYVPAVIPAVFTLRVADPVPVPDAGLTLSQAALSVTVQLNEPPPVLEIVSGCALGLTPPCVAVNEKLDGLVPMVGGADKVKETEIV